MLKWLRAVLGRRSSTGEEGERIAAAHLRRCGYRLMGRNLRSRQGEVDILAEAPDRKTIVVVEVKATATSESPYPPEVHLSKRKQRKLVALAATLARRHRFIDRPLRFDLIAVECPPGQEPAIRHYLGAFESHI